MTTARAQRMLAATKPAIKRPSIEVCPAWFSRLAIVQQHETYEDKTYRPDPGRDPAGRRVETQLEPPRPAGGDAEEGEGNMGQFDKQLFLGVDDGMRMRQQQGAADCGDEREGERGVGRRR